MASAQIGVMEKSAKLLNGGQGFSLKQRWQDCQQLRVYQRQIEGSWGHEESAELMEGSQNSSCRAAQIAISM